MTYLWKTKENKIFKNKLSVEKIDKILNSHIMNYPYYQETKKYH
jgi:hypothetical protein